MKATEIPLEKPLPSNLDAERNILGAILLDNKALDESAAVIKPADFMLEQHSRIFNAMMRLAEKVQPIDLITLVEELHRYGHLEDVGGAAYVSSLADGMPRVSNVSHYAKLVREKSLLRQLIHATNRFQQLAFDAESTSEMILDTAVQSVIDLALEATTAETGSRSYQQAAVSLLKSFSEKSSIRAVSGLTEFDKMTGGIRETEILTITAGTGVGKTILAQQFRRQSCKAGIHSLYCSGEMTGEHLLSRELATEACVEHKYMRRPEVLSKEEFSALTEAATHECKKCAILDGALSLQRIRLEARRKKHSPAGLGLLIIDYDELIDVPGRTELDQQRELMRGIKGIAIELKIPVIIISQLRKALDRDEAKRPSLDRIYGGGSKSKHSSFIVFVDREYVRELKGDETEARICVLKARDGRVGEIPVKFNVRRLCFEDPPEPSAKDDSLSEDRHNA
jgi:replicative DNA helicase